MKKLNTLQVYSIHIREFVSEFAVCVGYDGNKKCYKLCKIQSNGPGFKTVHKIFEYYPDREAKTLNYCPGLAAPWEALDYEWIKPAAWAVRGNDVYLRREEVHTRLFTPQALSELFPPLVAYRIIAKT